MNMSNQPIFTFHVNWDTRTNYRGITINQTNDQADRPVRSYAPNGIWAVNLSQCVTTVTSLNSTFFICYRVYKFSAYIKLKSAL